MICLPHQVKKFFNMLIKIEPKIGACRDEADCSNNGACKDNRCECNLGYDDKDYPDCSSKLH